MRSTLLRSSLLVLPAVALSLSLGGCPPIDINPGNKKNLVFDRIVIDSADTGAPAAVKIADFDGDTRYDVISAWKNPGEVRLHLQQRINGELTWQNVSLAWGSLAQGVQAVATADINGDGRMDAIVATSSGRILYLCQAGADSANPANWNVSVIDASQGLNLNSWSDVQISDVDGDTQLEVIATLDSPGGRVCIFDPPSRPANGTGWTRVDVAVNGRNGAAQVIPIDMNADGAVDLLTIARDENPDSVVWYRNPGNSIALSHAWVRHRIGHVDDPRAMALAYVDADAFIDVIVTAGNGHGIWGFQAPTELEDVLDVNKGWVQHSIVSLGSGVGSGVYSADMDGDSVVEVISATGGAGKLSLYKWDPVTGTWVEKAIDNTTAAYGRPLVVDLDRSGAYDVVCAVDGAKGEIVWYRQQ